MLLQYSSDTNENELHPKAINLRKNVASRKLKNALVLSEDPTAFLLPIKESNRQERQVQKEFEEDIKKVDNINRVSLIRASQHFEAQSQMHRLHRDLERSSRLSRSRIDHLTDLETRISKMRLRLQQPDISSDDVVAGNSVEADIRQSLGQGLGAKSGSRNKLDSQFGLCGRCGKRVLIHLLGNHEKICKFIQVQDVDQEEKKKNSSSLISPTVAQLRALSEEDSKESIQADIETNFKAVKNSFQYLQESRPPVYSLDESIYTSLVTFPPQPPRNCRVLAKGATFIHWRWEPPVIDGGLVITDYEIRYKIKIVEFNKKTERYSKWEEEVSSLRTSQWCISRQYEPIAHFGYKMTGLRGGTEYHQFQIRCCNLRGWSDWVDMVDPNDVWQPSRRHQEQLDPDGLPIDDSPPRNGQSSSRKSVLRPLVEGLSVFTDEPEEPSCPLFLTCDKITSTCMYLSWSPPFYDGGSEVVDYIVFYTLLERQVTVTDRDVIVEHSKKFRLHSSQTFTVVRNLIPDTEIINIYIRAVNKVELLSPRAFLVQNVNTTLDPTPEAVRMASQFVSNGLLPEEKEAFKNSHKKIKYAICRTNKSSRYTLIMREIELAESMSDDWIDSAFFTGVKQRLNRVEHMRQLQAELKVTDPDPEEFQEAREWAALQEEEKVKLLEVQHEKERKKQQEALEDSKFGELLDTQDEFVFTFRQRRQHFKRKIASLHKEIEDLKDEKMRIENLRTKHTLEMRAKEKHLLQLKLEIERLKHYTGSSVSSSILTGSLMQYKASDYRVRVDKALEKCMLEISSLKFEVIAGQTRKNTIVEEIAQAEEKVKERIAKFHEFDASYQKTMRIMSRLSSQTQSEDRILFRYFQELKRFRDWRRAQRKRITDMFLHVIQRYMRAAFGKWKVGEFQASSSKDTRYFASAGSVMLQQSMEKRLELQDMLRSLINSTTEIKQKMHLTKLSQEDKKQLHRSSNFKAMEEGLDHRQLYLKGLQMLYEGDGYAQENKFELAKQLYEAQILWIRSRPKLDIKMLAICHGRLGKMFLKLGKKNRAIVEFDRQLSLGKEVHDLAEEGDAYFGLGTGYLDNYDYENAIRYFQIAQSIFLSLGTNAKFAGALRGLRECYDRLGKKEQVQLYAERIEAIENDLRNKVQGIYSKLEDLKSRLSQNAAEIEHVVSIERTTLRALELKKEIKAEIEKLEELEDELGTQEDICEAIEGVLDAIQKEMKEAEETDDVEMLSMLVHDQPQVVEIEELKSRLALRRKQELEKLTIEREKARKISVRIKNVDNSIEEGEQQLSLEEGALMKHSRHDKPFRTIGLCAANTAGNEVTGTATGGYEEFAAAEGMNLHLIDYHSGSLNYVFVGGQKEVGHTGVITCLLHDGRIVYSGSTDESIIAWDIHLRKMLFRMEGHEGSVVALASESEILASSSSDVTIRLWKKHSGEIIRVVYGHSKSVLTLQIGPSWMITGSADEELRVWNLSRKTNKNKSFTIKADCTYRLLGHQAAVSCVSYGKAEVVSGDINGLIFIWWLKTGTILRKCKVHKGKVVCLQFDSIHIVSGGVDKCVCITDIATGEVLQSLRGHEGHILGIAFDSERIISVGGDNSVRYWQWGKKAGPQDKFHVLDKGETMMSLAKKYTISISQLMKWNGIIDMRQFHPGMKLLVRKGDPNALTDAEKAAQEREIRRQNGMKLSTRKLKESDSIAGMAEHLEYDRVHKIATDIDFFSLGNRLFGRAKRQYELFPDTFNPNENSNSLGYRLKRSKSQLLVDSSLNGRTHFKPSKTGPRYFISADNEDEWGEVADGLGLVMLQLLVEYEAYEVVLEQKRQLRSKQSVIGRINQYQIELDDQANKSSGQPEGASSDQTEDLPSLDHQSDVKEGHSTSSENLLDQANDPLDPLPHGRRRPSSAMAPIPEEEPLDMTDGGDLEGSQESPNGSQSATIDRSDPRSTNSPEKQIVDSPLDGEREETVLGERDSNIQGENAKADRELSGLDEDFHAARPSSKSSKKQKQKKVKKKKKSKKHGEAEDQAAAHSADLESSQDESVQEERTSPSPNRKDKDSKHSSRRKRRPNVEEGPAEAAQSRIHDNTSKKKEKGSFLPSIFRKN